MKHFFVAVLVVFGMLFLSGSVHADLSNGLVAYYPLEGDATDASGNGNDGIAAGVSLVEDRFTNPHALSGTTKHEKEPLTM